RGWLNADNVENWPDDASEKTEMARGLFGLALVSDADNLFEDFRQRIDATALNAGSNVNGAYAILKALSDEQKAALLTVFDDHLDLSIHMSMLRLDRFDHGFMKLQVQRSDPVESMPIPDSEIDIISDSCNELFQDALQWKEDFSRGTEIGRREPHRD
ncbi:MAG: hypothetical protein RID07_08045, partial [Lacipirellulaceae bacterium]